MHEGEHDDIYEEPQKDDNIEIDEESVYAGSDEEIMASNSTDEMSLTC